MKDADDVLDLLRAAGQDIPKEKIEEIRRKINKITSYVPRVGVMGKTGAGKSSLCNALFGKDIAETASVEACTREAQEINIGVGARNIVLIDLPGVGESDERDLEYREMYQNTLPNLDLILWVIKSDDRAMAIDEKFHKEVVRPAANDDLPIVFVVSQVNKISPDKEWNRDLGLPGDKQKSNILAKADAISRQFDVSTAKIVPVSAEEKYGLHNLVESIVTFLPNEKKMAFSETVNEEHVSAAAKEEAKEGFFSAILSVVKNSIEKIITSHSEDAIKFLAKKVFDFFTKR